MGNNAKLIGLVVVVLAIIIGILIFGGSDKGSVSVKEDGAPNTGSAFNNSVVSADGAVTLNFNDKALPAGVKKEDIKISRLSDEDIFPSNVSDEAKLGFIAAYNFEPDGISFKSPVEVVMELEALPEGELPVLYHVSENFIGPIDNVMIEIKEGDESKVVATGEIEHFSKIQAWGSSFKATGVRPGKYPVGANVLYEATIKKDSKSDINIYDSYNYLRTDANYVPGSKWSVAKIGVSSAGTGILVPAEREIAGKTGLGEGDSFLGKAVFGCESKGKDLLWGGPISLTYSVTSYRRDIMGEWKDIVDEVTTHTAVKLSYECTGPLKLSIPDTSAP